MICSCYTSTSTRHWFYDTSNCINDNIGFIPDYPICSSHLGDTNEYILSGDDCTETTFLLYIIPLHQFTA